MSEADRLNRIAASVPLDRAAGAVVSKGEHYEARGFKGARDTRENCPPTIPIPEESLHSCADLPGKKVGRLTVIGLAAEQNSKKRARWVVRCQCGRYEFRKAKALRNPEMIQRDRCLECENLANIKARYERLGPRSIEQIKRFAAGKDGVR